MKHILLFSCAIILLSLLAVGCFSGGSVKIAQNNATENISSPQDDARIAALQSELDGLQNQIQSARTRFARADEAKNWDAMQQELRTVYSVTAQIGPKIEESCRLQRKSCTQELELASKTVACMNRTDAVLDDMGVIYTGAQGLSNCSSGCPDGSTACITGCNAAIRGLKQSCIQLRARTPDVLQACSGLQNDLSVKIVEETEQTCRVLASMPYLRSEDVNTTEESQPDLQVLPLNQTEAGPSISGSAVLDPEQGRYKTTICSISADPQVILAGKETTIHFRAYAAGGERITYTCGEGDPRSNGNGGLIDTSRICPYYETGPTTVWVALDGYVCASAPLDVDSDSSVSLTPSCRVAANTQNLVRNGTRQVYSASVRFRHQPPSANLSWNCGGQMFSTLLGDLKSGELLDDAVLVSCAFGEYSLYDTPGRVYIDYTDCGSISSESN